MTICRTDDLLLNAKKGGYAVAGIKVWDVRSAKCLISAAEETRSPVTILMNESDFCIPKSEEVFDFKFVVEEVFDYIKKTSAPISLHYEEFAPFIKSYNAMKIGFNSFILDAAEYDYKKNMRIIKEMTSIFHKFDCCIEAQLGEIPISKNGLMVEENIDKNKTNVEEAIDFVKNTSLDILAPNIGNVHSVTNEFIDTIDLKLLKKLKDNINVPMSLHGGSGVSEAVKKKILAIGGMQLFWIGSMNFKIFGNMLTQKLEDYKKQNFYNFSAIALINAYDSYKDFAKKNFRLLGSVNRY